MVVLVLHDSSYVFSKSILLMMYPLPPNSIMDKKRQFKLILLRNAALGNHAMYINLCKIIHLSREYSQCYNCNQTMLVYLCRSGHILHYSQHTHSLYYGSIIIGGHNISQITLLVRVAFKQLLNHTWWSVVWHFTIRASKSNITGAASMIVTNLLNRKYCVGKLGHHT